MPTVFNQVMTYKDINLPERYFRDIYIPEDLIIIRENFFEDRAKNFRVAFNIDSYIQICSSCPIPYGHEWLDFDEVERRAFEISINQINIERHKQSQNEKDELKKQFESFKPYKSGFSDIPMPSIRMT